MRQVQVAVVGAGPAGISAALHAAKAGAQVLLIDEAAAPGGHLRWSIAEHDAVAPGRGFEIAASARDKLASAGVEVLSDAIVWGLFEDRLLGVVVDGASMQVQADAIILATGSTDIVYPFAGWELPGVLTARAALRLMHLERVLPGTQVVVVGQGTDADEVRDAVARAGATVVASAPSVDGVSAHGNGAVEQVTVGGQSVAADTVIIALGKQPDAELALHALCDLGFSDLDGVFVPLRSASLETSVPGVYVVGDAAGVCSTLEAQHEGALAGCAASGADTSDAQAKLAATRSAERQQQVERLRVAVTSAA